MTPTSPFLLVDDLQARVGEAIAALGGYWAPAAAALRLTEELGEVAEALAALDDDGPGALRHVADELADVVVITTCLANQFLCRLETEHAPVAEAGLSPVRRLAVMVVAAGRLATTINYYDGPKNPRPGARLPRVGAQVAALHTQVAALADDLGVDLLAHVQAKLDAAVRTDTGRFAVSVDPSTSPAAARFTSENPDAAGRWWGAEDVDDARLAAMLARFAKAAGPEGLDGFVVASAAGNSVTDAARGLVARMQAADPAFVVPARCTLGDGDGAGVRFAYRDVALSATVRAGMAGVFVVVRPWA